MVGIDLLFFKMTDNFLCQSVNDLWRQNPRVNTVKVLYNKVKGHRRGGVCVIWMLLVSDNLVKCYDGLK